MADERSARHPTLGAEDLPEASIVPPTVSTQDYPAAGEEEPAPGATRGSPRQGKNVNSGEKSGIRLINVGVFSVAHIIACCCCALLRMSALGH